MARHRPCIGVFENVNNIGAFDAAESDDDMPRFDSNLQYTVRIIVRCTHHS